MASNDCIFVCDYSWGSKSNVPVEKMRSRKTDDELNVVFAVVSMHRASTSLAKSSFSMRICAS